MVAEESDSKRAGKGGGERRGSRERRRAPVTIDLKAEEVDGKAAEAEPSGGKVAAAQPEAKKSPAAQSASAGGGPAATHAPQSDAPKPEATRADASARPSSGGSGRGAPPKPQEGWRGHAIAGVAGGVAVFILIILLQSIGLIPTPDRTTAGHALEQAQGASDTVAALERRVMALEAMTGSLPASIDRLDSLAETVTGLETADKTFEPVAGEVDSLKSTVADLGSKLDAADAANQKALDDLGSRVDRLARTAATATASGGTGGGSTEAIAALSDQVGETETGLKTLGTRIDELEKTVSALQASSSTGVDSARAARAVALASLRRAADGGQSFTSDVNMLSALGVSGDAFDALRPLAADGVPSAAELASEFPSVANAILSATAQADPDAGFFDRLFGSIGGLVSIRPTGPVAGDDPPAIVSRMKAAVDKDDLQTALKERDALPDAGKQASADWAAAAADRIKVDSLVDQVAQTLDASAAN